MAQHNDRQICNKPGPEVYQSDRFRCRPEGPSSTVVRTWRAEGSFPERATLSTLGVFHGFSAQEGCGRARLSGRRRDRGHAADRSARVRTGHAGRRHRFEHQARPIRRTGAGRGHHARTDREDGRHQRSTSCSSTSRRSTSSTRASSRRTARRVPAPVRSAMRGLSETNTLVLLNGRRLPVNALYDSSGAGAAVDINMIPISRSSASKCSRTADPRSTAPTRSPASSTSSRARTTRASRPARRLRHFVGRRRRGMGRDADRGLGQSRQGRLERHGVLRLLQARPDLPQGPRHQQAASTSAASRAAPTREAASRPRATCWTTTASSRARRSSPARPRTTPVAAGTTSTPAC